MTSCLYECHVMHARFAPRPHTFAYRLFLFAIDLDEIGALDHRLRLFSASGRNLYSFRDADFFPVPAPDTGTAVAGLKHRIVRHLAGRGIDLTGGRVMLIALPRVLGYLFNPVAFYFCYNREGQPVAALAEVTNTFREVKPYTLGPATRADGNLPSTPVFRLRVPKYFYVSPFSDVDVLFDFQLQAPDERLQVKIDDYIGEQRTLTSVLTGTRRPLTDGRLAWFTCKYPLITLRVIGLIHWHAFLLWCKKVPWFPKAARAADQRALYRPHGSLPAPPASVPRG